MATDHSITGIILELLLSPLGIVLASRWKLYIVLVEFNGFDWDAPNELPAVLLLKAQGHKLLDKLGEAFSSRLTKRTLGLQTR